MIAGYFLINSSELKIRKLLILWARIFFYSVTIYFLFVIANLRFNTVLTDLNVTDLGVTKSEIDAFSLKTIIQVLMPITRGKGSNWWFVKDYFVLYLIHPYVNRLLHSFNRIEYRKFLLAIGFYWCIIPTLMNTNFGANGIINFVCIYSLAGYVRLYPDDFGRRDYIIWGLAFAGINFLSAVIIDVIGTKIPFVAHYAKYFFGMMRPFTILASLCLFIGFRDMNIPHSKIINVTASACFGVYLIHENKFMRPFLWHEVFNAPSYQDSLYLIPYSIVEILSVYIFCSLIELTRLKIFRTLSRGYLS